MSKSSELDKVVKQYILDHIDNSGYSDQELTADIKKVQFLKDTFYAEYGWHVDQNGEQQALADWFAGLPTACNIEWRNHAILELAYKWGSLPENAKPWQENKILENWFSFIGNKTGQLFRKHCREQAA